MGIGKTYEIDFKKIKDKITEVEIYRISDNKGDTVRPYFTQSLISKDSKILLCSSNRTGNWQLYKLDIGNKQLVQLTDDKGVAPLSACLDPDKLIAYYWSDKSLKAVNVNNYKNRELYQVPEGFNPGILSLNGNGDFLDFAYSENLNLSTDSGEIYSGMRETLYRRPTSVIIRVEVKNGEARAVWGERRWISHVNTSPVDENIILFCHEGPWHLVQRMWIVKADTNEVWPLVEQKKHLERSGHELFTDKGRIVTQYGSRKSPESEWNNADIFIDPDGSEKETYWYPGPKPMHVQINSDETLGVGDSAFLNPDFKQGKEFICLIKYKKGKARQHLLCKHKTSWKTQYSHPHPIFTPDDRNIIFNSDRGGKLNIYMVPVVSDLDRLITEKNW